MLKPGMTVLEFGCGTGHMACEIAKAVGPAGRVIATDNSEAQIANCNRYSQTSRR